MFFPNVELRLEVGVNKANEEVNIHIIFSNKISKEKIEDFLSKLETNITKKEATIHCNTLSTIKDFETAGIDYKKIKPTLKKVFGNNDCYLIFAAANNQGLRADTKSLRKMNICDEIDKICDGLIGGSQNTEYYLKEDRYEKNEDGSQDLASKYPVVSGSDSHSFIDIDNKLGKEFIKKDDQEKVCDSSEITWIKANPTFEGLRQIIYEPKDRVKIQKENPELEKKHYKIKSLEIYNSTNSLLVDQKIPFNSNLVSIIGGRGAGKTSLLNILNLFNAKADSDFIEWLKIDGDADLKCILINKDGNEESFETKISGCINESLPIYYLSQNDIETFSRKEDSVREAFLSSLGITEHLSYYNDEITNAKSFIEELQRLSEEEKIINEKYEDQAKNEELSYSDFADYHTLKITSLNKQKEKYSTKETKEALEEISKLSVKGISLKKLLESAKVSEIRNSIITLNKSIEEYNTSVSSNKELQRNIKNISEYDISLFEKVIIDNNNQIETKLNLLRGMLKQQIIKLEKLGITDYKNITEAIEKINRELIELDRIKSRLESISNQKKSLQKNLSEILPLYETQIKNAIQDIDDKFEDFTKDRNPLFNSVFSNISVSGSVYFNNRKFKNLLTSKFLSKKEKWIEELTNKLEKNNPNSFFGSFGKIWGYIENHVDDFKQNGYSELLRLIFVDCMEHIKVQPKIEMNGCELGKMSGGQQATLLLKLKLASEGLEKDIIIFDQPENHLDNAFIVKELVELLKNLKKEKQVIIASHNANAVVSADSEQIIISKMDSDSDKSYISGALENSFIKENVINILEGGKTAFEKRKKKYNF